MPIIVHGISYYGHVMSIYIQIKLIFGHGLSNFFVWKLFGHGMSYFGHSLSKFFAWKFFLDMVCRFLDIICRFLDIVCRFLDMVCRILDMACSIFLLENFFGHGMSIFEYAILIFGHGISNLDKKNTNFESILKIT